METRATVPFPWSLLSFFAALHDPVDPVDPVDALSHSA